jgi:hypothetical protein
VDGNAGVSTGTVIRIVGQRVTIDVGPQGESFSVPESDRIAVGARVRLHWRRHGDARRADDITILAPPQGTE